MLGKTAPRVSVIMSVYNGEKYLREAIESILTQTFTDFEFMILDDGSTDRSTEIIASYQDERIRCFSQSNMGMVRSLNRGVRASRGEYIARQDQDDISLPRRLEHQVTFLDDHPAVGLVGTQAMWIGEQGRDIVKMELPTNDAELKAKALEACWFVHGSVVFRRRCIEEVGTYRECHELFEYAHDYDLWLRIGERYEVANISSVLYKQRLHSGSITALKDLKEFKGTCLTQVLARERARSGVDPLNTSDGPRFLEQFEAEFSSEAARKAMSNTWCGFSRRCYYHRHYRLAWEYLLKSFVRNPWNIQALGFCLEFGQDLVRHWPRILLSMGREAVRRVRSVFW